MIFRDQIHGDMELSNAELRLVRTKAFERMRYIKQLAFAEYEYAGATHNRYQHSLGVCQCITDMYNAVNKNSPNFFQEGDLELLRMMALVHDLGHSPFSHASEVLSDITHEERLTDILRSLRKDIILPINTSVEAWDLVNQVYQGDGYMYISNPHYQVLHTFMDGFIDADKLDYLERDALNCGVSYGVFDRQDLINNLCILRDNRGREVLGIKEEGIQALESFILARYYMFNKVYFNPQERIYRYQYVETMQKLLPNGKYPNDVKKFLALDDTKYVRKLPFLLNSAYKLVYNTEFNAKVKQAVESKLGDLILCDTPKKVVFRRDESDTTVWVKNSITGAVVPCAEVSPIIKGIQFANVHKLRFYTQSSIESEIREQVLKIAKGVRK